MYPNLPTSFANLLSVGTRANTELRLCTNNTAHITIAGSGLVTFADAVNVTVNTTTGTKWGTATGQKQAWWGSTPVVQQVLATGAGATVDNVISLLQTLGLCKQS
jgi:hypothetical protein